MKNLMLFCLLFALQTTSFAQTRKVANSNLHDPKTAKSDAKTDLKNGLVKMLTYGYPQDAETRDRELAITKQFGFQYVSIAGCIVDNSIMEYAKKYNEVIEAHLVKKYGKNWRVYMDEKIGRNFLENLLKTMDIKDLREQYTIMSGHIYFDKNKADISPMYLKFIEANAKEVPETDQFAKELGGKLSIYLTPYLAEGEDAKMATQRAEAIKNQLIKDGLDKDRIVIKAAKKEKIECPQCPFQLDDYQYKVLLDFEK